MHVLAFYMYVCMYVCVYAVHAVHAVYAYTYAVHVYATHV